MDLGLKGKNGAGDRWQQSALGSRLPSWFCCAEGALTSQYAARNADEVGKAVKALAAKGGKSWGKALWMSPILLR